MRRSPFSLALAAGFLPVLRLGLEQGLQGIDPYILRVLNFTLLQAGLSTLLSLALGLPLARALARQQAFPGRALLVRLLNLPLALPAITVIIGIIEVYGANGWLGGLIDIYGLQGILLAHVFFNAPLAARLILSDLERIPPESFKLSAQLGLGPAALWRIVEWPQLRAASRARHCSSSCCARQASPSCSRWAAARARQRSRSRSTSRCAPISIRNGPPCWRFVQLALCATLALLAQRWGGLAQGWPVLRLGATRHDGRPLSARLADGAVILFALLLLLPPLAALIGSGIFRIQPLPPSVQGHGDEPWRLARQAQRWPWQSSGRWPFWRCAARPGGGSRRWPSSPRGSCRLRFSPPAGSSC
jgi:thiamine transport system permease protein